MKTFKVTLVEKFLLCITGGIIGIVSCLVTGELFNPVCIAVGLLTLFFSALSTVEEKKFRIGVFTINYVGFGRYAIEPMVYQKILM